MFYLLLVIFTARGKKWTLTHFVLSGCHCDNNLKKKFKFGSRCDAYVGLLEGDFRFHTTYMSDVMLEPLQ